MILADDIDTCYMALTKAKDLLAISETQIHLIRALQKKSLREIFFDLFKNKTVKELEYGRKSGKTYLYELKNRIRKVNRNFIIDSSFEIKKKDTNLINTYLLANQIELMILVEDDLLVKGNRYSGSEHLFLPNHSALQILYFLKEIESSNNRILLIPVFSIFSDKKIKESLDIARRFHAHIHIVTILEDQPSEDIRNRMDAFYLNYKAFSDFGHRPQYKIISRKQPEDILLSYAKRIKANMIYLTGEDIHDFRYSIGKNLKNIANRVSGLQVLTLKMHDF